MEALAGKSLNTTASKPLSTVPLGDAFPKLHQWLSYGGQMWVRPRATGGVEILLGDAGGFPADTPLHADSLDEALKAAETEVGHWLVVAKQLQENLSAEDIPELRHEEFIRVAGWPPVLNLHFRGK